MGVLDLDGAILASPVNLRSNRVGNGSRVELPVSNTGIVPSWNLAPWQGDIDLQGSTYRGTLEIRAAKDHPWLDEASLMDASIEENVYCAPRRGTGSSGLVNLAAADIRILTWDLPLNCKFRWRGYGLTYNLWLAGEAARKSVGASRKMYDQAILPAGVRRSTIKMLHRLPP